MHEVSIAQGLLEIAIDNCKKHGYQSIDSIKAKVGKASGIVPDSLLFAFEALKQDTIAGNATLIDRRNSCRRFLRQLQKAFHS